MEKFQFSKLKKLLHHAYEKTPYYRRIWSKAGHHPDRIQSFTDFRERIPIIEKADVRIHRKDFICSSSKDLIRGQTGSSTGEPLVFFRNRLGTHLSWTCYLRFLTWVKYTPGYDNIVKIWGQPIVQRSLIWRLYVKYINWLKSEYTLNAFKLDEVKAKQYLDLLVDLNPKVLRGYVSALVALAKVQLKAQKPLAITSVLTTAEQLFPQDRALIESAFGTKVFNEYGCGECLAIACECEQHSGLHVNSEHCLVEIVDEKGNLCSPGHLGQVVVTDLDNFAMPFIRYKNGDIASMCPNEECACGKTLPMLENIIGRTSDMIQGKNGKYVHGEFFTHLLEQCHWFDKYTVSKFQVVQRKDYSLKWDIVISNKKPSHEEICKLVGYTKEYLGDLDVEINFVKDIHTTPSGKRRFTRSELLN